MARMAKYLRYKMSMEQENGGEMRRGVRNESEHSEMRRGNGQYSEMRNEMRNPLYEMRRGVRNGSDEDDNDDLHTGEGDVYTPDHRPKSYGYRPSNHYGKEEEDEERKPNVIGFGTWNTKRYGESSAMNAQKAREWVKSMRHANGGKGEHWPLETVKKLAEEKGVKCDPAELYAIMNALYSDYCEVFKKHGNASPELYLDLAVAWLEDEDAVNNKAAMYYDCIVKH